MNYWKRHPAAKLIVAAGGGEALVAQRFGEGNLVAALQIFRPVNKNNRQTSTVAFGSGHTAVSKQPQKHGPLKDKSFEDNRNVLVGHHITAKPGWSRVAELAKRKNAATKQENYKSLQTGNAQSIIPKPRYPNYLHKTAVVPFIRELAGRTPKKHEGRHDNLLQKNEGRHDNHQGGTPKKKMDDYGKISPWEKTPRLDVVDDDVDVDQLFVRYVDDNGKKRENQEINQK